jgi:hypothetical protein
MATKMAGSIQGSLSIAALMPLDGLAKDKAAL